MTLVQAASGGPGRFITLEGIEGAGKSTQRAVVEQTLREAGIDLVLTREPGGSPIAERLRDELLDSRNQGMHPDAELLLMFAARAEHLHKTIEPALASGPWVLCDRFTDATYAYQGGGRQLSTDKIAQLEQLVQGERRPDLTLIFDLPVEVGLARARARSDPDRFESETLAFFERTRAAYLEIAHAHPERVRLINADQTLPEVSAAVRQVIQDYLSAVSPSSGNQAKPTIPDGHASEASAQRREERGRDVQ